MKFWHPAIKWVLLAVPLLASVAMVEPALAQTFRYQAKPRAAEFANYSDDPAPLPPLGGPTLRRDFAQTGFLDRDPRGRSGVRRASAAESIPPGSMIDPFGEESVYDHYRGPARPAPPTRSFLGEPYSAGLNYDGPVFDESYSEGPYFDEPYDDGYGDWDDGDCYGCGRHTCFPCLREWACRCGLLQPRLWENLSTTSGAQAFKGPVDRGVNGNFGFNKGLNWATPLCDRRGIGFQLGTNLAFSDFEGGDGPIDDHRYQYFFTGGFFRRAACDRGFQWGAVVDYLHDDFYVSMNLLQLRSELSYRCATHEFGFWGAAHLNTDSDLGPSLGSGQVTWLANNQYNFFYRRHFCNGGNGRMWIGTTDYGDLLFGADALAPLSRTWAVQANYNYLLPSDNGGIGRNEKESFGVNVGLVWFIGYKSPCSSANPYRPLFPVADNSWLFINERRGAAQHTQVE